MKQLVVTLVYIRDDNQVLLAMKKTGHGAGYWNGAGGKVEADEMIEQAMIRECQEEIGVTPVQYEKIAQNTFYQPYKGTQAEIICHTYMCMRWDGEPTESSEMAPQWFNCNELPLDHMWPCDRLFVPRLLAGEKLVGEFYFDDNNNLIAHKLSELG